MKTSRSILFPFFCICYAIASLALFLFSYTQVDLSLTLSSVNIFQTIQKTFQYVGFYQRPIATAWYCSILVVYFILYAILLWAIKKKKISVYHVWILVIETLVILVLSYPAFSYDLFNHMFYAKEILLYHKNPYILTPLQFTGVEPWLSFMHWTHVPSVYSPLWTIITLPAYIFGFGYFLLILWNFKILMALFYLITTYYIARTLHVTDADNEGIGIAFFALNPLVLIESLVSAHNDIAMMAFAVMSVYFFVVKKHVLSYLFLALSAGVKFITVFLYPSIVTGYKRWVSVTLITLGFFIVLTRREVMPWYLLWIIPYAALIPGDFVLTIASIGASLGLLLRYAPYLYFGDWNNPVPRIEFWVTLIPLIMSGCIILFVFGIRKIKTK
jgi:hypothetical protein